MTTTETRGRTFAGVPLTLATTVLIAVAYLAAGIAIARALGPSGRGQLAALVLWATLSVQLALLGTNEATVYVTARYPRLRSPLRRSLGRIIVAQAIAATGIFVAVAWWRSDETALPIAALVVFAVWAALHIVMAQARGYVQGLLRIRAYNAIRLVGEAGPAIVVVTLALLGLLTVSTAAGGYLVALAGGAALAVLVATQDGPGRSSLSAWRSSVLRRSYWSYALRAFAAILARRGNRSIDLLILTLVIAETEKLGFYAVAVTMGGSIAFIGASVGAVAFPRVAGTRGRGERHRQVDRYLAVTAGVSLLAAIFIALLADPLVRLVYGEDFAPAIPVVRLLAFSGAALSVQMLGAALLRGFGRPGLVAIAEVVGFVITLVGVLIGVRISLTVVAAFALAGSAVAALIEVVILRRLVGEAEPAEPALDVGEVTET